MAANVASHSKRGPLCAPPCPGQMLQALSRGWQSSAGGQRGLHGSAACPGAALAEATHTRAAWAPSQARPCGGRPHRLMFRASFT